jgi:hypothetical protein
MLLLQMPELGDVCVSGENAKYDHFFFEAPRDKYGVPLGALFKSYIPNSAERPSSGDRDR